MLKSSSLCLYSSNLGTFWLKIEQFWPFEEIPIYSNGGHLTPLYHFCTYYNPVTFLFPALSRIPSPNSTTPFLPQAPYWPISALTPPPVPIYQLV
jgi:hypothetical protein